MQKWDKKYLLYLKNKYMKLAESELDVNKQLNYEDTISSLDLIFGTNGIYIPSRFNYVDSVNSDLDTIDLYANYCPIMRTFSPIMEEYNIENTKLKKIDVTEQSLFKQTECFFRDTDSKLFQAYSFMSKKFDKTFNFNKAHSSSIHNGQTFSIAHTNHCFYEINLTNTLVDYVSMAHEIGHGINVLFNKDIIFDFNKRCFIEADSIFLEMINNEYIGNKFNLTNEAFYIKLQTLYDYLYSCDLICSKMDMYIELNKRSFYNEKEAKFFYSDLGYNKRGVNDIIHTYIYDTFHYVVSYLTAVELYLIYNQDKKEGLRLYSLIRDVKGLDCNGYLSYVRSIGIEPGKNIHSYINTLINYDKKGEFIYAKKF